MQRPLASGDVPGGCGEDRQAPLQPVEDRRRGQELHPGGRELDAQRQAIEPARDFGHGARVVVGHGEARRNGSRALNEQGDGLDLAQDTEGWELARIRDVQWRDRELLLTGDAQHRPARDEDVKLRGDGEELGDNGRTSLDHLLEVVEDQQQLAMLDELPDALLEVAVVLLADPERRGGGRSHRWAIPSVLEGDEVRPVGEVGQEVVRRRECQPGLAGAARRPICGRWAR
jgi:hypothetical protein